MKNVVIGFLGTQLDMGKKRRWKPTPSLVSHDHFKVDRLELLYDMRFHRMAKQVQREIEEASPETEVLLQQLDLKDPWDFQEVYGKLFDFARAYGFDDERERYHVHLTTGTHVAQICWFLLTESRHVPARLIQTGPPGPEQASRRPAPRPVAAGGQMATSGSVFPITYGFVLFPNFPMMAFSALVEPLRDGNGWIDDGALFAATWDHRWPDPLRRIVEGLTTLVDHPAQVLFSLAPGWTFGPRTTQAAALLMGGQRGTHGGLGRAQSTGFVCTVGEGRDMDAHAGPALRPDAVFAPFAAQVRAGAVASDG